MSQPCAIYSPLLGSKRAMAISQQLLEFSNLRQVLREDLALQKEQHSGVL